ncbi:MAG TPA: DUF459 domain-containing protein, partial [Rhizobiales bacterium]|nr:DUF459 domain-containing protein [Hyphomicrobiales bacterium]
MAIMLAAMSALMPLALSHAYAAKISYAGKRVGGSEKPSLTAIGRKSTIRTASLSAGDMPIEKTNLMVLGDSLGDGVWAGLYRAFRKDKNIRVMRRSKPSTGFVRVDYYDWNANLVQILNKTRIDIAVVMVGANDRQTISTKAGPYRPGSNRWR